jgi:hypothetical protein
MKRPLKFCPDLRACALEDRLVPVMPNLGQWPAIVLTTNGYVLASAFPGAAFPASFVMTGSAEISGVQPGTSTANGGAAGPIVVGSGANDAVAPVIALVTRDTVVNDALRAAPQISRVLADRSDVLPPGQVYRGGSPVTASGGVSTKVPGQPDAQDPGDSPVEPLPIRLRSRPHRLAVENNPAVG